MSANDGQGTNGNGGPKTIAVPAAGEITRQTFGGSELERKTETASTALATAARAAVEARFVMAFQRPRHIDDVRVKILAACKRPLFAKGAVYSKPVGKKKNPQTQRWEEAYAEGLSIRFAEEAIRSLGNAMTESLTIYDDTKKRIIRVSATDLETNVVHYKDIVIEKTVERKTLKPGQSSVGQRINSYGDVVHIVEATDDDLATKAGALGSKALRDKILMLIPSDIQEEAKALIWKTQSTEDAVNPDAAKKVIIDSFAENGIMPNQLAELLGHDLTVLQPAELQRLRAIYAAIKEGEATWSEIIDQIRDGAESRVSPTAGTAAQPKTVNDLAADAKAKREAASKPTAATAPAPTAKPATRSGQQAIPMSKAAPAKGSATDEDPGDVPPWMSVPGGKPPTDDDGTGIT